MSPPRPHRTHPVFSSPDPRTTTFCFPEGHSPLDPRPVFPLSSLSGVGEGTNHGRGDVGRSHRRPRPGGRKPCRLVTSHRWDFCVRDPGESQVGRWTDSRSRSTSSVRLHTLSTQGRRREEWSRRVGERKERRKILQWRAVTGVWGQGNRRTDVPATTFTIHD